MKENDTDEARSLLTQRVGRLVFRFSLLADFFYRTAKTCSLWKQKRFVAIGIYQWRMFSLGQRVWFIFFFPACAERL